MIRALVLATWLIGVAFATSSAARSPEVMWHKVAEIPLPGVDGRIDHMTMDAARHRLFVAALGHRAIEVVDLTAGKRMREIGGWTEPQGLCYAPEKDRLFVADGDGRCVLLNAETFEVVRTLPLGEDADNIRRDGSAHRVVVGFGNGGLAVLDAATGDSLAVIPLPAHPESFQLATGDGRIFVNVPGREEVVVADRHAEKATAQWPLRHAAANFPMALDEKGGRLFIGCRKPPLLLALDLRSGSVLHSAPLAGDVDDLFFDPQTQCVMASCGEGFLETFSTREGLTRISRVPTRAGARTSFWDADSSRLYVAAPKRGEETAALLVYERLR